DVGAFENQFPPLLTITAVNAVTGLTEGDNTGSFTVATFTSSWLNEPASSFTVVVSWGDGTSSTYTSGSGLSGSGGSYAVTASHTYAEEINTPTVISVQLFESSGPGAIGGTATGQSSPFTIADAALTGLALNNPAATEGIGTGTFTVATFTDNYSSAPFGFTTDFTATVTWGDGRSSAGAVVTTSTPGVFAVLASHTYAEEGTDILSVDIPDVGGSSVSGSLTITVADAALGGLTVHGPKAT